MAVGYDAVVDVERAWDGLHLRQRCGLCTSGATSFRTYSADEDGEHLGATQMQRLSTSRHHLYHPLIQIRTLKRLLPIPGGNITTSSVCPPTQLVQLPIFLLILPGLNYLISDIIRHFRLYNFPQACGYRWHHRRPIAR